MPLTEWYVDTETVGLYGVAATIQYSTRESGGSAKTPVCYWPWAEPVRNTLDLIEAIGAGHYIGFNNVFDLWHLTKLYNIFKQLPPGKPPVLADAVHAEVTGRGGTLYDWSRVDPYAPIGDPNSIPEAVPAGYDPYAIIPHKNTDLMILARQGAFQSTQKRRDITIKYVPERIAEQLIAHLEAVFDGDEVVNTNVDYKISDIHFAYASRVSEFARQGKPVRWHIENSDKPTFPNVVLKFKATSALKPLVREIFGIDVYDYPQPRATPNDEGLGYVGAALMLCSDNVDTLSRWQCPYFSAKKRSTGIYKCNYIKGKKKRVTKGYLWPALLAETIEHWHTDRAQLYAIDDVNHLIRLYDHYLAGKLIDDRKPPQGQPAPKETPAIFSNPDVSLDSELSAHCVATRYRGFNIDVPAMMAMYKEDVELAKGEAKKSEILASLPPLVVAGLGRTPKGAVKLDKAAFDLPEMQEFPLVKQTHNARRAGKRMELFQKLFTAGCRFQASVKPQGTLTHRMAGADGLNPQAIPNAKEVRALFSMVDPDEEAQTGDFASFEVAIADGAYEDPDLRSLMSTCYKCGGRGVPAGLRLACQDCGSLEMLQVHSIMGTLLYPGHSMDEVRKSKGVKDGIDMYTNGKRGVFACFYGGNAFTMHKKIGVSMEVAEQAYIDFFLRFPKMMEERNKIDEAFTSLYQPNGIGSQIYYKDPPDSIANMFGQRRYFHLENKVISALYHFANKLPRDMETFDPQQRVMRRDRKQTYAGAVRTALYAACFQQQGRSSRAANNMRIQSSGAVANKILQWRLVEAMQPRGVHHFRARALQVHDSLWVTMARKYAEEYRLLAKKIMLDYLDELRPFIPFLGIDWVFEPKSFAD